MLGWRLRTSIFLRKFNKCLSRIRRHCCMLPYRLPVVEPLVQVLQSGRAPGHKFEVNKIHFLSLRFRTTASPCPHRGGFRLHRPVGLRCLQWGVWIPDKQFTKPSPSILKAKWRTHLVARLCSSESLDTCRYESWST